MLTRLSKLACAGAVAAIAALPVQAVACKSEKMATNEHGFILKVVAGSDKIVGFKTAEAKEEVATLSLLQPYFVICTEGEMYRITDLPASTVDEAETGNTSFVRKDQVFIWPTREALNFNALIFDAERPEVVAWEEEDVLKEYMRTGDAKRFPPAFQEDMESTLKRPRTTRPYPVLSSTVRKLRERRDKRVYKALIPAALTPAAKVVVKDGKGGAPTKKEIEKILKSATFAVVFDATGSMGPIAKNVARELVTAFESLPKEIYDNSRMGFVFFRDATDPEKIVISDLMPMKDASNLLLKAASRMTGGGDVAEPILDAAYVATHLFKWEGGGSGQVAAGRKIVIGVLNGDAKPETTGKIHDKVPLGIDANTLANQMRENGVTTITMQASKDAGPNLIPVLSALAETTGGTFIAHGGGESVAQALAKLMREKVVTETKSGGTIGKEIFDFKGFPAIPLKVLDGERMERLRRAGLKFNIDDGKGGVLVREAFIIENPDLLEPRIQIKKDTLVNLINLFSVLGTTGVDAETMIEAAGEAIAAIAGEDFDRKERISVIIKKKLGIQFRTKLLSFDLQYIAGLTPDERLALTKRIQDAGNNLGLFLEANLKEFDSQPTVWMPMDVLP